MYSHLRITSGLDVDFVADDLPFGACTLEVAEVGCEGGDVLAREGDVGADRLGVLLGRHFGGVDGRVSWVE